MIEGSVDKPTIQIYELLGEELFRVKIVPLSRNRVLVTFTTKTSPGEHLTVIGEGRSVKTHRSGEHGTRRHRSGIPGLPSEETAKYLKKYLHRYHPSNKARVPTTHYFALTYPRKFETEKEIIVRYDLARPDIPLTDEKSFHSLRIRDLILTFPGFGYTVRRGGVNIVRPLDNNHALFEPVSRAEQALESMFPLDELLDFVEDEGERIKKEVRARVREIVTRWPKDKKAAAIGRLDSSKKGVLMNASEKLNAWR